MKGFVCSNLAFAGVLLLALGSTPGTLSGQSQTQGKTPSGSTASPAASGPVEACPDSKTLTEQLNSATRTTEQELQEQLACAMGGRSVLPPAFQVFEMSMFKCNWR